MSKIKIYFFLLQIDSKMLLFFFVWLKDFKANCYLYFMQRYTDFFCFWTAMLLFIFFLSYFLCFWLGTRTV